MSAEKNDVQLNPNPESGSIAAGEVCIPNISTEERLKRLRGGVFAFVIGIAILAVLVGTGTSPWWRALLFLPFAGAATGFFQWQDKTCVGLSARQSRKFGDATEKIEDPAELAQVRRQANRVQLKALATGLALTLVALVLP